jgi:hypothetical protein
MTDDDPKQSGSHDLDAAMIFVRHGDPELTEWMARHPGHVRIPAVMVPREASRSTSGKTTPIVPAAALGTAATAGAPGWLPEAVATASTWLADAATAAEVGLTGLLSDAVLGGLWGAGIPLYPKSTAGLQKVWRPSLRPLFDAVERNEDEQPDAISVLLEIDAEVAFKFGQSLLRDANLGRFCDHPGPSYRNHNTYG